MRRPRVVVEGYMQAPVLNGSGMTQDRAIKLEARRCR
jgi:hypothetical protein